MKNSDIKSPLSAKRGVALITTLVLASAMALLVIAYLVSMRIELGAASAYENTQSVKVLSQSALSHGIELLRSNIPEPGRISETVDSASAELWVTNPGRLTVIEGQNEPRYVALHTGAVLEDPGSEGERDLESVDLNRPLAGEVYPPICVAQDVRGMPAPVEKRPELRVRWRNVLRDPSQVASKGNQIVGRYAFWMDDESGKINFNVAAGKTPLGVEDNQRFHEQLATGMMTPNFNVGSGKIMYNTSKNSRRWALGQPRSVNLGVLTTDPEELDEVALLDQAWLKGFSRYPEAIMDFVKTENPVEWYHHRKHNLTFYSRSPEFNAFGRSRFFTTNIPLSLESGPNYQLPFVAGSNLQRPEDGPLHLHALMSLGQARNIERDVSDVEQRAHNVVNQGQVDMLMGLMRRKWPGYQKSFVDKYGEKECYQIAITTVLWPRIALAARSQDTNVWAARTTSAVYAPPKEERPGAYPERLFWRFEVDGKEELMLPQVPGPHITEVRLRFELEAVPAGAGNEPTKFRVKFRHESEYYMHPFGPVVNLNQFPVKVDYLKIEPNQGDDWEVGTADPDSEDPDRDWNHGPSLFRLQAFPGGKIAPFNTSGNLKNRRKITMGYRYIGKRDAFVPANKKQARVFELNGGEDLTLDFKIRLGMGRSGGSSRFKQARPYKRPRQMIPMGDTDRLEHVLDGRVELSYDEFEPSVKYVSYYIQDPRLSGTKAAWTRVDDDDPLDDEGRDKIGQPNLGEPFEQSSEKSKFRFFAAGGGRIKSVKREERNFQLNQGDEFTSFSAVSSPGYWSLLHTGIQSNVPWRTLDLTSARSEDDTDPQRPTNDDDPPDYLLLDLFGATYPMQHDQWKIDATLPDAFSTVSFMNSTAGKINLNTRVYPQSPWFQAPERKKPLEAVFKHLRPDEEVDELVDSIIAYQQDEEVFDYIGELAEVEGYERKEAYPGYPVDDKEDKGEEEEKDDVPTKFEKEELLRNMAGCLTTNSNTFSLWGVAQVVTKQPYLGSGATPSYGKMEVGDGVRSEKRFFAIIERYIWAGKDGVPGNGHVDSNGRWDRIATPNGEISPDGTVEDANGKEKVDGNGNPLLVDRLFDLPGSPPQVAPDGATRLRLNTNGTYPEYDGPEEVGMDPYTERALGKVKWTKSDLADAYNPPQPVIKYRVVYFKYLDS